MLTNPLHRHHFSGKYTLKWTNRQRHMDCWVLYLFHSESAVYTSKLQKAWWVVSVSNFFRFHSGNKKYSFVKMQILIQELWKGPVLPHFSQAHLFKYVLLIMLLQLSYLFPPFIPFHPAITLLCNCTTKFMCMGHTSNSMTSPFLILY